MAKSKKSRRPRGKKTADNDSTTAAETKLSRAEQFRLDYAYVVKDLRTVFILAGIMFALLIVLNLILQ